jgi:hypothetical protein
MGEPPSTFLDQHRAGISRAVTAMAEGDAAEMKVALAEAAGAAVDTVLPGLGGFMKPILIPPNEARLAAAAAAQRDRSQLAHEVVDLGVVPRMKSMLETMLNDLLLHLAKVVEARGSDNVQLVQATVEQQLALLKREIHAGLDALIARNRIAADESPALGHSPKTQSIARLIRTVRALDNAVRDHLVALEHFHESWPSDRREDAISRVAVFANRSELIVAVRDALAAVAAVANQQPQPDASWACALARDYLLALGTEPGAPTPFPSQSELERYVSLIRAAAVPSEAERVREFTRRISRILEPHRLEEAEHRCRQLLASPPSQEPA